jgi:hypothetical protein
VSMESLHVLWCGHAGAPVACNMLVMIRLRISLVVQGQTGACK